ncbi:unnamed protein product, partial [Protopolystoma xenopodis]
VGGGQATPAVQPPEVARGSSANTISPCSQLSRTLFSTPPASHSDRNDHFSASSSAAHMLVEPTGRRSGPLGMVDSGLFDGPKMDVYSAGVSLYFMLTGRVPFASSNVLQIFEAIAEGVYTIPGYVSSSAASLIHGMMANNPKVIRKLYFFYFVIEPSVFECGYFIREKRTLRIDF